jgi:hypothetical protein
VLYTSVVHLRHMEFLQHCYWGSFDVKCSVVEKSRMEVKSLSGLNLGCFEFLFLESVCLKNVRIVECLSDLAGKHHCVILTLNAFHHQRLLINLLVRPIFRFCNLVGSNLHLLNEHFLLVWFCLTHHVNLKLKCILYVCIHVSGTA